MDTQTQQPQVRGRRLRAAVQAANFHVGPFSALRLTSALSPGRCCSTLGLSKLQDGEAGKCVCSELRNGSPLPRPTRHPAFRDVLVSLPVISRALQENYNLAFLFWVAFPSLAVSLVQGLHAHSLYTLQNFPTTLTCHLPSLHPSFPSWFHAFFMLLLLLCGVNRGGFKCNHECNLLWRWVH